MEKINSLSEVTKNDPFLGSHRITSIIDLDGVLCEYGRKNNSDDNISRLLGLRDIISKSENIMINSNRFSLNEDGVLWQILEPIFDRKSITNCPFITKNSIDRLANFAKKANPNCKIEFNIGLKKMEGCFGIENKVLFLAEKTLEQDKKLVMIGSSIFDRQIINQTASNLEKKGLDIKNIHFFDTGHWVV